LYGLCRAVGFLGCVRQEPTSGSKRLRQCEKDTTAGSKRFAVSGAFRATADSQVLSKGYRSTASVFSQMLKNLINTVW